MKTPDKDEHNLLTLAKILPRRFFKKLENELKKDAKNWTPFEGVPESIPISKLGEKLVPIV
jgi:hypothetical protein